MSKYLGDKANDLAVRSAEDTYAEMQTEAFYQTAEEHDLFCACSDCNEKYRLEKLEPQPAPQADKKIECTCHLSLPSYADFIGNHSPMCPMNRDSHTSYTPDLLKQLAQPQPTAKEEKCPDSDCICNATKSGEEWLHQTNCPAAWFFESTKKRVREENALDPSPGKDRVSEKQVKYLLQVYPKNLLVGQYIRQLRDDLASVCKTLENYEDILEKEKADHCDALEQLASVKAECLPWLERCYNVSVGRNLGELLEMSDDDSDKLKALIKKLKVKG